MNNENYAFLSAGSDLAIAQYHHKSCRSATIICAKNRNVKICGNMSTNSKAKINLQGSSEVILLLLLLLAPELQ